MKEQYTSSQTVLSNVVPTASALRICMKIFEFWQLSELESFSLLGLTCEDWQIAKCALSLPPHALDQLPHIIWIARLSTDLYPLDKDLSVSWLRRSIFEYPFLGMSPLSFMLSESEMALKQTHHFLDKKFVTWGALRDKRNELVYLNDSLRINDEPLDTLLCMAFRVTKAWRLTPYEELGLIGVELSLHRLATECVEMHIDKVERLRMITLIDLMLWHIFHDHLKVAAWVRGKNTHPLFEGNPPLHLLCSGKIEVMKVVYAYLRNISP